MLKKKKNNKTILITTPMFYPNGNPHIGHLYTMVLAESYKIFKKKIQQKKVFLLTGMDVHGEKISYFAKKNNKKKEDYVNQISKEFKNTWDLFGIKYDYFTKTNYFFHKKYVQKVLKFFYKKKLIYFDYHKSFYCIFCEENFTKSQLIKKELCMNCKRKTKINNKEAYFFKVKKFRKWILNYWEKNINFFSSKKIKNELTKNFINNNLVDLCITRKKIKGDIQIPFDKKYSVYVWFDALISYLSFFFRNNKKHKSKNPWKDNDCFIIQIIGKEISRFHYIYWPIILKNLKIKLPQKIITHGLILKKNEKISKSKNNFFNLKEIIKKTNVVAIKYYLLSLFSIEKNNNFKIKNLIEKYNSDLANNIGNLIFRFDTMVNKFLNGKIKILANCNYVFETKKINKLSQYYEKYTNLNEKMHFSKSIDIILKIANETNKFIAEKKPWKISKKDISSLIKILKKIIFKIRIILVMLLPFAYNEATFLINHFSFSTNNIFSLEKILSKKKIKKLKVPIFTKIKE